MVLPDLGGTDVLAAMKRMCPSTPVVIFTAYSNMGEAFQAIAQGASDYISKPFSVTEILERVSDLLIRDGAPVEGEDMRQQWAARKRRVRRRLLNSAFS